MIPTMKSCETRYMYAGKSLLCKWTDTNVGFAIATRLVSLQAIAGTLLHLYTDSTSIALTCHRYIVIINGDSRGSTICNNYAIRWDYH